MIEATNHLVEMCDAYGEIDDEIMDEVLEALRGETAQSVKAGNTLIIHRLQGVPSCGRQANSYKRYSTSHAARIPSEVRIYRLLKPQAQ